jgi:methylmalonyl-CoA/ethylmalonyl-CoA epimerase
MDFCGPSGYSRSMKLDHIAVAVRDIERAVEDFEKRLGLRCERIEDVPTEAARVAFFDLGGPHLELVMPTGEGSVIARSLERRGEGLHHICLEVADLEKTMAALKAAGLVLTGDSPSPGAGGSRITFVHPKSLHGVLIELVEKAG